MRLNSGCRPWAVLNYAVTEPNQWTEGRIARDMRDNIRNTRSAIGSLIARGLVVKDLPIGKGRALLPTPAGVEALYTSI